MSGAPHSFNFHIGDYIRDTRGLSMMEHGAYLLLMLQYYSSGKPLPAELAELYKLAHARTHSEKAAVQSCVSKFFRNGNATLVQTRIERELTVWAERTRKARDAANAKWGKTTNKQTADDAGASKVVKEKDANACAEQCSADANACAEQCPPLAVSLLPLSPPTPQPGETTGAAPPRDAGPPAGRRRKKPKDWWETHAGIEAKARDCGMWPARANESWDDLKARVLASGK